MHYKIQDKICKPFGTCLYLIKKGLNFTLQDFIKEMNLSVIRQTHYKMRNACDILPSQMSQALRWPQINDKKLVTWFFFLYLFTFNVCFFIILNFVVEIYSKTVFFTILSMLSRMSQALRHGYHLPYSDDIQWIFKNEPLIEKMVFQPCDFANCDTTWSCWPQK